MGFYKMYSVFELPLCWALLFPAAVAPQMPPQPGKLIINSNPVGLTIKIKDNPTKQLTNATFIVSAGRYTVSIADANGNVVCPEITLSVSPGQTIQRNCPSKDWVSSE
jgi:hypothetical protein